MTTAIVVLVAVAITVLAFVVKDKIASAVLHAVGMIAWLVVSYLLYNQTYSTQNTFMPTATMLIGVAMTIVHTTFVVIPILSYFKNPPGRGPSYEEEQNRIKTRIASITQRRRGEDQW